MSYEDLKQRSADNQMASETNVFANQAKSDIAFRPESSPEVSSQNVINSDTAAPHQMINHYSSHIPEEQTD